ncbi:Phosphatidylinositol N-acetylglucosaminyltransferase GPI3 subunit [Nakaseomyces bracarensis]|uniref:phosphatidylinositol N-acetylglucosaminyltransferase n=1 Tax=Nakaseomyces bracarensis TaxID=273131 RepID=A0ABR4NZF2_9SACH
MGYNIAMVCDFFYPQLGGVEFHIYHLAQNLLRLGHSVVVISHAYKDRVGVRYLTNGLKVYHVPFFVLYRETTFPSIFSTFPILRNILLREQIDIVHSHGSVSTFAHQVILHANTMGLKTVFTDHSLYGFDALGSILVNKLLTFNLTNIDRVICVSNTCKENMVMRADLDVERISVIPNAVVSDDFRPRSESEERKKRKDRLTIVVISRLFPNKGADLLVRIIPIICKEHKDVDFIVAGDGPKFIDIQQMIESHRLESRVTLLGSVAHEKVRDVMCKGDIYLHASLTEAFGTVLVEAASCGLLIVTTMVGGIPEVLPEHMTVYANETSVSSLVEATERGIQLVKNGKVDPKAIAKDVSVMYDWMDVARRTVDVYNNIFANGKPEDKDWVLMVGKFFKRDGSWARLLYVLCCVVSYIMIIMLDFLYPRSEIDLALKWPTDRRMDESTTDHNIKDKKRSKSART